MAFVLADRVRETTTTNGTGAIYPSGVVTGGYQTFNSVLSNGDTTLCLVRNDAGQWQTFLGTWNSGTQSMARPFQSALPTSTTDDDAHGTSTVDLRKARTSSCIQPPPLHKRGPIR